MPYEILSSDVTQDSNSRSNSRTTIITGPNTQGPNVMKFVMILLHLSLIAGSIFLVYVIFVTPFLFEDSSNFKLVGEISSFSTELNQSLVLQVGTYNLTLESGTQLNGQNEEFEFDNFTGRLYLKDDVFVISGRTPVLKTKTSEINSNNEYITLEFKRGGIDIALEELHMNISQNLDVSYRPDLIYSTNSPSSIRMTNFSGTLSYDSLISLYGNVYSFTINNNNSNIEFN